MAKNNVEKQKQKTISLTDWKWQNRKEMQMQMRSVHSAVLVSAPKQQRHSVLPAPSPWRQTGPVRRLSGPRAGCSHPT